ncbi:MAG: nitrogen fixation protein NifZ [Leptospirillum sp.]|jgi:nitrogen fixation protein NifZ|nr:nitrogen fixation protein NifZ [Nitrospiraceae bacterium]
MIEPRVPRFDWGMVVTATEDLFNDGSYPDLEKDEKLVANGTRGEIVRVGTHEDSNTPVYLVEFEGGKVVGCLEEEIRPLS